MLAANFAKKIISRTSFRLRAEEEHHVPGVGLERRGSRSASGANGFNSRDSAPGLHVATARPSTTVKSRKRPLRVLVEVVP